MLHCCASARRWQRSTAQSGLVQSRLPTAPCLKSTAHSTILRLIESLSSDIGVHRYVVILFKDYRMRTSKAAPTYLDILLQFMACTKISSGELPAGNHYVSGDFARTLPNPAEIRQKAARDGIDVSNTFRPDPVRCPELGLLVKWGADITIAEGQCLWFLGKHLSGTVPVPEIYGWVVDNDQTFLYMQLVDADSLQDRWTDMSESDRLGVCTQLRDMISAWRKIHRSESEVDIRQTRTIRDAVMSWLWFWRSTSVTRLSQIGGQALRDILFYNTGRYPAGPFDNIHSFHDWFAALACPNESREGVEELAGLDDNCAIVFTHGDLDHSNILVSKAADGPPKIVAIIDWHQSGWYPEPWEWLKSQMVAGYRSQWSKVYLPKVLKPAQYEYHYAWEYVVMATI